MTYKNVSIDVVIKMKKKNENEYGCIFLNYKFYIVRFAY